MGRMSGMVGGMGDTVIETVVMLHPAVDQLVESLREVMSYVSAGHCLVAVLFAWLFMWNIRLELNSRRAVVRPVARMAALTDGRVSPAIRGGETWRAEGAAHSSSSHRRPPPLETLGVPAHARSPGLHHRSGLPPLPAADARNASPVTGRYPRRGSSGAAQRRVRVLPTLDQRALEWQRSGSSGVSSSDLDRYPDGHQQPFDGAFAHGGECSEPASPLGWNPFPGPSTSSPAPSDEDEERTSEVERSRASTFSRLLGTSQSSAGSALQQQHRHQRHQAHQHRHSAHQHHRAPQVLPTTPLGSCPPTPPASVATRRVPKPKRFSSTARRHVRGPIRSGQSAGTGTPDEGLGQQPLRGSGGG